MKTVNWRDLNIKERLAIITALAAFIFGWGLSISAFIVPPMGEISNGILWILGQSLIYAASVFGITGYFNAESVKLRYDMDKHFAHMEHMQMERMKIRNGVDTPEIPMDDEEG